MAAMAMEREGDVSRFIDTYKFDQQREDIRQKYGGGTSLPLHSDGLEDRRQRLREERRQEMLLQQEKQPKESAYYRVGTPEKGLPGLGSYEEQRSKNNVERQREYNQFLQKQRQLEQQKLDAHHRSPPRPPVQAPGQEMDYQASHEQARAEDRRYYQDYMGKYHSPNTVLAKPPVNYEENRKVLNEERKREYNMLMEKKAKEERERAARGRTVTPPGGLDIGQYDRSLKENAQKRKNDYREILVQQQAEQLKQKALDRAAETSPRYMHYRENERPLVGSPRDINFFMREQQKEHMYLRARQEPEIPVIDRAAQQNNSLASKPPPGPGFRPREDAFQTDSLSKPSERPAHGQPPYPGEGQRQTDISKLFPIDDARRTPPPRTHSHQFEDRRPNNPQTELAGRYSPSRPNRNEPGRPGSRDRWNLQRPAEPATTLLVGTSAVDSRRREGSQQRKQEYREYLERKNEEEQKKRDEMHQRAMSKPAEVVKNQYYSSDSYEHYQKDLHRKQSEEYRDFLNKKKQNISNRGWDYSQSGILELRGHDAVQTRKRDLRSERQKEYLSYINQTKPAPNHKWPEPEGKGALLVKKGEYDNIRQMYDLQRKNEFQQMLGRSQEENEAQQHSKESEQRAQSEPAPNLSRNVNPIVQSMGRYEDIRKQLKQIRRNEFKQFQEEHKSPPVRPPLSASLFPRNAGEETPLVNRMENYEEGTRKRMQAERRKDFQHFREEQLKHVTPRNTVKENLMPQLASAETPLVSYMGHYDEEKRKFRMQRFKEQREYGEKQKQEQHSPYENFVFPTVARAEKPMVENMGDVVEQRRQLLREERKRDYERYQLQQKMKDVPRRHDYIDSTNGPFEDTGIFARLGDHGNTKDLLRDERKNEYLQHLEKHHKDAPTGRPSWAKDTLTIYSDRGRSPMKPGGLSGPPVDHYQQMLNEKRREEAQHRRFDDPEFQDRYQNSRENQRYNY